MMFEGSFIPTDDLIQEAKDYAHCAAPYTSDRHDFHEGGLEAKERKMAEGKYGEKAFKMILQNNGIPFEEDHTSYDERDKFDFLLRTPDHEYKIDVKTRTEKFHTRTLEMVEQANGDFPKDIYVSAKLTRPYTIEFLGWYTREDMLARNHIENHGYLDNYAMYDHELRPMSELETSIIRNCI